MDAADTGFVLMSAALVMFMTPGLALFYGGMVRAKNVLATLMQSFILLGLVSVLWAVVGYTLAFGTDLWQRLLALALWALVVLRHSENIDRLRKGTESKITSFKKQ